MLAKFSVKNFRGFTDKIELDLTRHSNYNFSTYAIKDDVIKNGIIYGPFGLTCKVPCLSYPKIL